MKRLPLVFTVAGTLPFVALSVAVSMHAFADNKAVVEILLTYAAVIVSFIGGVHWGIAVGQFGHHRKIANLLIAESVWPSVIAWGTLLYTEIHIQMLVLTLLYTFVWAIDSLLYNNNLIPQWFFTLRCIITPIVVVSLYVAYFGLGVTAVAASRGFARVRANHSMRGRHDEEFSAGRLHSGGAVRVNDGRPGPRRYQHHPQFRQ